MRNQDKIQWLSIVQGWAILLVVVGHVNGYTYSDESGEMYPLSTFIRSFCYAFHMPLFMFVSGGLLYLTRIDRRWPVSRLYVDKLKRLLAPYLFFTLFAFLLKGALSAHTKRGVDVSPGGFLSAFVDPDNGPLAEMWFLATLMWLMALYPFFRHALKRWWTEALVLTIALVALIVCETWNPDGWLNIKGVPRYAFFFFGGVLFFKYHVYRIFENRLWLAALFTVAFLTLLCLDVTSRVIVPSLGIMMSIGWGIVIVRKFPGVFSSFRDYSFQIFLIGIFPQMFVELFLWKRYPFEYLQIPYYVVSILLAIAISVAVTKLVDRSRCRWLRWCFGLKDRMDDKSRLDNKC